MVLVLDIARYHYASLLKPLPRKYRSARTLFLLLYSLRLASVERGWKLTSRKARYNRFFTALDGVLQPLENAQLGTAEAMWHKSRRYP